MRLLIVEDHEAVGLVMARTIADLAERAGGRAECVCVTSLAEAVRRLGEAESFSAVLLDLKLADAAPEDTLTWLSGSAKELPPVIVFSGLENDRPYRKQAFAAGADDFLHKLEIADNWRGFFRRIVNAAWRRKYREGLAYA
jgi:CheY-like chemotaxis protein